MATPSLTVQRSTYFGGADDADMNALTDRNNWQRGATRTGLFNTIVANQSGLTKELGYIALSPEKQKALGVGYGDVLLAESPNGRKPVLVVDPAPVKDAKGRSIADLDPVTHSTLTPKDEGLRLTPTGRKVDLKSLGMLPGSTPSLDAARSVLGGGGVPFDRVQSNVASLMPTDIPPQNLIAGTGPNPGVAPVQTSTKPDFRALNEQMRMILDERLKRLQSSPAQGLREELEDKDAGIRGFKEKLPDGRTRYVWPGMGPLYTEARKLGIGQLGSKSPSQVQKEVNEKKQGEKDKEKQQQITRFKPLFGITEAMTDEDQAALEATIEGGKGVESVLGDLSALKRDIDAYQKTVDKLDSPERRKYLSEQLSVDQSVAVPTLLSQGRIGRGAIAVRESDTKQDARFPVIGTGRQDEAVGSEDNPSAEIIPGTSGGFIDVGAKRVPVGQFAGASGLLGGSQADADLYQDAFEARAKLEANPLFNRLRPEKQAEFLREPMPRVAAPPSVLAAPPQAPVAAPTNAPSVFVPPATNVPPQAVPSVLAPPTAPQPAPQAAPQPTPQAAPQASAPIQAPDYVANNLVTIATAVRMRNPNADVATQRALIKQVAATMSSDPKITLEQAVKSVIP